MSRYINYGELGLAIAGTLVSGTGAVMLIAAVLDAVFWAVHGYSHVHDSALLGIIGAFVMLTGFLLFVVLDDFYN